MTTQCQRAWEVEAARDGRLTGDSRESFERHVVECAACARDIEVLDGIARGLRDTTAAESDDATLRRMREHVLETVDARQTGRAPSSSGRRGAWASRLASVALAAIVVLAVIGLVGSRRSGEADRATAAHAAAAPAPAETKVSIDAKAGARFVRSTEGDLEQIALLDGELHVKVDRPVAGRRVVVKTPDGEIEDVGTVFDVVVGAGRVERVAVAEGRVIVRVVGHDAITIDAGNEWRASPVPASAIRVSVDSLPSVAPPVPTEAVTIGHRPTATATATAATTAAAKETAERRPVTDADREDAAYLEVLRLLREGHEQRARAAATQYLVDFPSGFRREEMRRVSGPH